MTKNYVRVTGALHGNVLLLKSWQPVSEPQPFVIAEWERLRDKATAHLEKHAMTFAPEADTVRAHEFAFALLRHESVTNVVAVDTPRGRLFIVASPDPSSAEAEINDHGLTDHVLVLEARWSADAVEQADEVLSGLPDDENVMISGGISSHGEPIHEIVLLRRNDHFTRLTELFPAEQVAVRAWIHPA
ncbi:hypothetical protein [Leifsonia xyli]|nr:hypothetical protein [Leifsonia xyli]